MIESLVLLKTYHLTKPHISIANPQGTPQQAETKQSAIELTDLMQQDPQSPEVMKEQAGYQEQAAEKPSEQNTATQTNASAAELTLAELAQTAAARFDATVQTLIAEATAELQHAVEALSLEAVDRSQRILENLSSAAKERFTIAIQAVMAEAEATPALEELAQEVRKVGREVFKTNRATERNQTLFENATEEIQQLAVLMERSAAQSEQAVVAARFETKAQICQDLLRVADALEASLSSADAALARLQAGGRQRAKGFLSRFVTPTESAHTLADPTEILRQWRQGQELIYARVLAILSSVGARAMEATGKMFDPNLHRAVSIEPNESLPNGSIIGEVVKGYTLDDRILRYAEVIVVKHG